MSDNIFIGDLESFVGKRVAAVHLGDRDSREGVLAFVRHHTKAHLWEVAFEGDTPTLNLKDDEVYLYAWRVLDCAPDEVTVNSSLDAAWFAYVKIAEHTCKVIEERGFEPVDSSHLSELRLGLRQFPDWVLDLMNNAAFGKVATCINEGELLRSRAWAVIGRTIRQVAEERNRGDEGDLPF